MMFIMFVFRLGYFHQLGLFQESLVTCDVDLVLRALAINDIPNLGVPTIRSRQHDGNISYQMEVNGRQISRKVLAESYLMNSAYGIQ